MESGFVSRADVTRPRRVVTVPEMTQYPQRRMLAIIGSGETSPTMVTVHRDLVSRLGPGRPEAILLATPYAFQENAAGVSARAQRYFADSVGLRVRITAGTSHNADPAMAAPMVSGRGGRRGGRPGRGGLGIRRARQPVVRTRALAGRTGRGRAAGASPGR